MDGQELVAGGQTLLIDVLRVEFDLDLFIDAMQIQLQAVQRVPSHTHTHTHTQSNNTILLYNTKFVVKRHDAVASEALANRTVKKHRRRRKKCAHVL